MLAERLRTLRLAIGWWVLPAPQYRVEARLDVIEREVDDLSRKDTYHADRIRNQAELVARELGLTLDRDTDGSE